MKITVKLFGPQAQLAGRNEVEIDLAGGHVVAADVLEVLADTCPSLRSSLPKSRLAVDFEIVGPATELGESQEIALIGMLGGG